MKKPIFLIGASTRNKNILFALLRERYRSHQFVSSQPNRHGISVTPNVDTKAVFTENIEPDHLTAFSFQKIISPVQLASNPDGSKIYIDAPQHIIGCKEIPLLGFLNLKKIIVHHIPDTNDFKQLYILSKLIWLDIQVNAIRDLKFGPEVDTIREIEKLESYYNIYKNIYQNQLQEHLSLKNIEVRNPQTVVA